MTVEEGARESITGRGSVVGDHDPTRAFGAPSRCEIWGVLNVTPDSFSDGGLHASVDAALSHGLRLVGEGADVVDVGGESTRPPGATYGAGYATVSVEEELERVVPVVSGLATRGIAVSIDTTKSEVAEAALRNGARIVNDTSGGASAALLEVVAAHRAELVLMHNRGRGEVRGNNVAYTDVVTDVIRELEASVEAAARRGVDPARVWLDPGIGFAKTASQSVELLAGLSRLVGLGHRVLVGASRKSFLAEVAPRPDGERPAPRERLAATAVTCAIAVNAGAHAVRVHDVEAMRQAVLVAEAVHRATRFSGGTP